MEFTRELDRSEDDEHGKAQCEADQNVLRSGRNIEELSIQEAAKASTFEILNSQILLIHKSALSRIEGAARN